MDIGPVTIMWREDHLAQLAVEKALAADIAALVWCTRHGLVAGQEPISGGCTVVSPNGLAGRGISYAEAVSRYQEKLTVHAELDRL